MVADIQLLQGKIIDDPDKRTHSISGFIEELTREFIAVKSATATPIEGDISAIPLTDEEDDTLALTERLAGGTA